MCLSPQRARACDVHTGPALCRSAWMFPGPCCASRVELGRLGSTVTDAANRRGPQGTTQPQVAQVWDAGGTPEGPMARPGCVRRCAQGCPRPKDQRAQRPKSQLRPLGAAASRGLGCVPRRGLRWGTGQAGAWNQRQRLLECVKMLLLKALKAATPQKSFQKTTA